MSDVLRRAAEIEARQEAMLQRQRYIAHCQDFCRYVLPGIAMRAAERDGKRTLAALEALKAELERIASGR